MAERTPLSRPFGRAAEDLEFDFGSGDRPALVTALLAACAASADAAHWWDRPVGERTAALIALLRETVGGDAVTITLCCEAAGCGAPFEIELPHAALAARPSPVETVELRRDDGETLSLRRPTGADLRRWRAARPTHRAQAARLMLADLDVGGALHDDDVARAGEALSEADPLVAFSVRCSCPACGLDAEREIDLEGLALQRLAARQRTLLREVHAMASHYGWTEDEILAVAPARRARYLELIEGVIE